MKGSGRQNPNAKYALDDSMLREIDTEAKAYLLGWIASDGAVRPASIALYAHQKDVATIGKLRDVVCPQIPLAKKKHNLVGFTINSRDLCGDVCRWLSISPGKKDAVVGFPRLASAPLQWAFVRGYFDGDGSIVSPGTRTAPRCTIASTSVRLLEAIRSFAGLRSSLCPGRLEWNSNAALDFLAKIYDGAEIYLQRKRDLYVDWQMWVPGLSGPQTYGSGEGFRWVRALPNAVPPSKQHASDSGFDITVVAKGETRGTVIFYRTGIKVQPAFGWYFDLIARSSIVKTGHILANGIGVIDRTYIGEILVPLVKVDPKAPDLPLPMRIAQIVPRPIVHFELEEVTELDDSVRGEGGFGSTDEAPKTVILDSDTSTKTGE